MAWLIDNDRKMREYQREWNRKNRHRWLSKYRKPEIQRMYNYLLYLSRTPEQVERDNEKDRKYADKNREKRKAQSRERYKQNPERFRQKQRDWAARNRKKITTRWKGYYEREPNFRLRVILHARILAVLKGITKKTGNTEALTGCSMEFLRGYLESRFDQDMSWDNHGSCWHLDHIIPCSVFELSDPEEQKRCFHYTNLQPLRAFDNLSKKNRCHYGHNGSGS